MQKRKLIAVLLGTTSIGLIIYFLVTTQIRVDFEMYFKPEYYLKFSLLVIGVMLLDAAIVLFKKAKRTNLALAIFSYTILEECIFDLTGITDPNMPLFAYILLLACAIPSLIIAHTNTFNTDKLSIQGLVISLLIGALESLLPMFI